VIVPKLVIACNNDCGAAWGLFFALMLGAQSNIPALLLGYCLNSLYQPFLLAKQLAF
jgi:hypothetical protein